MKHTNTIATLLAALAVLCATLHTAGASGLDRPDRVEIDGTPLYLSGAGTLKYLKFISVYDAVLYTNNSGALRLEVTYRVGTEARRFNDAGQEILERNYSPDQLAPVADRITEINALYPDPEKGDKCAITYIPGRGTSLTFNGELLGTIPGRDFAEIYFSIWLGPDPASVSLRDSLLYGERKREDRST